MRRLCLLFALVGLMSAILAGAGGAADARAVRRKIKAKRAHPAAAAVAHPTGKQRRLPTRTHRPARATVAPTSPDVDVIARRLMIVGFDGRGAQVARGAAGDALRSVASVHVVPLRASDAMRLGTAYGAQKTIGLAQHLNLTAVLYGKISQAKHDVRLSMLLANGEDGRVVGELSFEARSLGALRNKVRAQLWSRLGPLIDQAASPGPAAAGEPPVVAEAAPAPATDGQPETPPADTPAPAPSDKRVPRPVDRPRELPATPVAQGEPPAPRAPEDKATPPGGDEPPEPGAPAEPTATGDEETQPAPEAPAARNRKPRRGPGSGASDEIAGELEEHATRAPESCPIAEVAPGGGIMARRFNYRGEQRGALRGYALYRAPVGRIDGTLYPFAGGPCRLGAGLGLRGAYEVMGPINSQVGGRQLATQGSAYQLELVLRMVSGRVTVQPAIGYLVRNYHVDGDVVPTANYRALGLGLDVGLRFRYLNFEIGAGGRALLDAGDLQTPDWFPRQTRYALSGRAQVGVAATPWIDIVAGAAAEYETFTFSVDPGAANPNGVAAGAYDLYVQGTLSVRFRLGAGGAGTPARARDP